jgi:peptidoglycan/LPS O-acetylase OafA/YrhL
MLQARGSADSHRTQYRSYIDGLRAVAVLSVIAYHASRKLLPGGYLGVDIFFVISGYLITNVIWREAINDEFSIARFYERRIRRIMPALTVLLLLVSALAIAVLLPIDLEGFAKSVYASIGFVANVYFWRDTDYFSRLADEKPLLHLWSLGVEEQFYILFPLLVVLCIKYRRSLLLPLIAALVVLSFAANVFALRIGGGSPAFYLLPTRAWELGAGALLVLLPVGRPVGGRVRLALALFAVVLLIVGLRFDGSSLWKGELPAAIWVVLGTSAAIFLGESGGNWLTRGLSTKVMVWTGLISYSLYLWHWPIFVFARYYLVQSSFSFVEGTLLFALMLILAALSWKYVERPFRDRTMPVGKVLAWMGCGCLLVVGSCATTLAKNGFPNRYSPAIARINAAVGAEYHCGMTQMFPFGGSRACMIAASDRNPAAASLALVGNSHAQMYTPVIADILRQDREVGILVPLDGCLPIPDYNETQLCMQQAARNLAAVEALPHLRVVILAMTWQFDIPMYTRTGAVPENERPEIFCDRLDAVIRSLEQSGKEVILVGPLAVPGYDAPSIVARQMAFGHPVTEPSYEPESQFLTEYHTILSHYQFRSDIGFIRPDRIECQNGRCEFFPDGVSLFADSNHVAESSVFLFRGVFESALLHAFGKSQTLSLDGNFGPTFDRHGGQFHPAASAGPTPLQR